MVLPCGGVLRGDYAFVLICILDCCVGGFVLLIAGVDLCFGVRALFCCCLFRLFLVVWVWCICLKMLGAVLVC